MSLENKINIENSYVLKKQEGLIKWIFKTLICSFILNIILVFAIIFMLPLKEKKPYLMFFSNAEQNFVRVLPVGGNIRGEEALLRTLIATYVSKRETINRIDDSSRFSDIREQSNPKVWDTFLSLVKAKDSIFQEERYTRKVIIRSVSTIAEGIAQVDFVTEKYREDRLEEVKAYRATLQYVFDTQIMKASDVKRNPLGFIVTKYAINEINENFVNRDESIKKKEGDNE